MSRYAVVAATFYRDLADMLIASARSVFEEAGHEVDVFEVPGAFELPLSAQICADSEKYAGIACVGAVIRGETTHYEYVCGEAARGIMDVSLQTGLPVGFGVLTVETMEQAIARASGGKRASGAHAAEAVLAVNAVSAQVGA